MMRLRQPEVCRTSKNAKRDSRRLRTCCQPLMQKRERERVGKRSGAQTQPSSWSRLGERTLYSESSNSLLVGGKHFHIESAKTQTLADLRHTPLLRNYQTGDGCEIVRFNFHVEQTFNFP